MTDPFFTTGNSSQVNNPQNEWNNTTEIIDNLTSQQKQIQEKYKELKELLNTQDLTQNQKEEIHEQMQKLSDLYSHNKATLASLTTNISWEKEIHVDKNINTDNAKSKWFSFKKFMIGCGILLMLFLGGLVVIFYSLIENPERLNAFWIDWCTAVNLLQLFSIVFFWLLFFLGLTLLLINVNRLIVSKNKRKFPFAVWAILSFIILVVIWVLLVTMLNKLSEKSENCELLWDTQLAHPYAIVKTTKFKNTEISSRNADFNKLVAPINIKFDLNTVEYKNRLIKMWTPNVTDIVLDCWNWQQILWWDLWFTETCFYTKAGQYQPELIVKYKDTSWMLKEQSFGWWYIQSISIRSEISVSSEQQKVDIINSSLLVWKNPVGLTFDAQSIFRDFNLSVYRIKWCAECDCNWDWDDISSVKFNREYKNEWLLDVCVLFPDLSDNIVYTFPIRVEQWEVAKNFEVSYNVTANDTNNTYKDPKLIEISKVPTTITVEVASVNPETPTTQKKLYKDWEQIASLFSNPNTFKFTITEDKSHKITLEVVDTEKQISSTYDFNIVVNRDVIIWSLSVLPSTVWTSPFTVKFDASTTTLNDPSDEIVFFSRDFWDGVKNPNLSEAIISHVYEYDFANENWIYYPSVSLRTKKWLTYVITWTIINVKKPETTVEIFLDENPAQLATVWETIPMSITVDWMPTKIHRDFWDGETQECDWRSCSETSHMYNMDWTYTISVRIEFEDKPALEWKINLLVQ